jgi:Collagenase NC10 and Endostatin
MKTTIRLTVLASAAVMALSLTGSVQAQQSDMSFFITSVGSGKGANLGGLQGADQHCQQLAQAAGAGNKTWRAYLSSATNAAQPNQTVNARDRIGNGPWKNAKGVVIANNLDDLHSENVKINKENGLTEKGEPIKGVGEQPNQHDVLTGSDMQGRAFPGNLNLTCNNWTSDNFGKAMLGHADRRGIADTVFQRNPIASHMSRGCSQADLVATGGAGLFYCFAQ